MVEEAGREGGSHLCEAKQLGAIKLSFAVGTIHCEAEAGSSSACSTVPFIFTPQEGPVNAMGVVKEKHMVFCWAGSRLMFNIKTANEKNFLGFQHHRNGSSMQYKCGLTHVIKLMTCTVTPLPFLPELKPPFCTCADSTFAWLCFATI